MMPVLGKRRGLRFLTHVPLQYRSRDGRLPGFQNCLSKNLSEGGMCFRTSEFIPHNTDLYVKFALPPDPRPTLLLSRVVHTKMLGPGDAFDVGVQFTRLLQGERQSMLSYLNNREHAAS